MLLGLHPLWVKHPNPGNPHDAEVPSILRSPPTKTHIFCTCKIHPKKNTPAAIKSEDFPIFWKSIQFLRSSNYIVFWGVSFWCLGGNCSVLLTQMIRKKHDSDPFKDLIVQVKQTLPSGKLGKLTWLAGKWTWMEDVFPIENGRFSIAMLVYWRVFPETPP